MFGLLHETKGFTQKGEMNMNWEHAISVLYSLHHELDDDKELIERGQMKGDINAIQERLNAINEAIGALIREGNT